MILKEICAAWNYTRGNCRGIFCVSDCWVDSHDRWHSGGIYHERSEGDCCCGCVCGSVFKQVAQRFPKSQHPNQLQSASSSSSQHITIESSQVQNLNDIQISPVQLRTRPSYQSKSIDSQDLHAPSGANGANRPCGANGPTNLNNMNDVHCTCCQCNRMKEDSKDIREKPIPHVSLFYAPPTFIRELCGISAFSSSSSCRRISLDECKCHGLWLEFFSEVLSAYSDRYVGIVWFTICEMNDRFERSPILYSVHCNKNYLSPTLVIKND